MSIELERLLDEAREAGIVFFRRAGKLSVVTRKGRVDPTPELYARLKASGPEINRWLAGVCSMARCVDCPKSDQCKGDCAMDSTESSNRTPPGIGSSSDVASA